jgi:hypothetical protein
MEPAGELTPVRAKKAACKRDREREEIKMRE